MKTGQAANNENFSLIHHAEKRLVRVARSADKRLSSIKGSESSLNLLIYLPFSLLLAVGQLEQSIKVPDRPSQNAEKCSFPVQRDVYRCNWAASGAINHGPFNKKFQKKKKQLPFYCWNFLELDQTFLVKTRGPMWIGSIWLDQTRKSDSIPFKFHANSFLNLKVFTSPTGGTWREIFALKNL